MTSFDDVLAAIAAPLPEAAGAWTTAQHLDHCAASIAASIDGYPALKPLVIRATIGAIVKRRFLRADIRRVSFILIAQQFARDRAQDRITSAAREIGIWFPEL